MSAVAINLVAFLTGIMASMGLGGGMVLIVYLTAFAGFSQIAAQGINLVFFVPIAVASLIFHGKNGLVEWKKAIPTVIWGTASVIVFSIIANKLPQGVLSKAFAVFLILMGLKELFFKSKDNKLKGV